MKKLRLLENLFLIMLFSAMLLILNLIGFHFFWGTTLRISEIFIDLAHISVLFLCSVKWYSGEVLDDGEEFRFLAYACILLYLGWLKVDIHSASPFYSTNRMIVVEFLNVSAILFCAKFAAKALKNAFLLKDGKNITTQLVDSSQ